MPNALDSEKDWNEKRLFAGNSLSPNWQSNHWDKEHKRPRNLQAHPECALGVAPSPQVAKAQWNPDTDKSAPKYKRIWPSAHCVPNDNFLRHEKQKTPFSLCLCESACDRAHGTSRQLLRNVPPCVHTQHRVFYVLRNLQARAGKRELQQDELLNTYDFVELYA